MTRVKICGITRREDALLAAELGASAIGFVFAPSPRSIAPAAAAAIAAALPAHVDRVGVFVDASAAEIVAIARSVRLTRIQLHGHETPDFAIDLPGALTRSLLFDAEDIEATIARWQAARPDVHFLLDAPKDGGVWLRDNESPAEMIESQIRLRRVTRRTPFVLAGGLTPDNVKDAIIVMQPVAVDVARGVEAKPGVKDPELLRDFFAAVRAGDRGIP
jgi:phosphoribosylanthranilate isomerase